MQLLFYLLLYIYVVISPFIPTHHLSISACHKYYNRPSTSHDGIFFRLELPSSFQDIHQVPSYCNIHDFDTDTVQANLDSQVVYKYINPVSFIIMSEQSFLADEDILVVAQCRWTVDMTEADRSNAWFEACWNSGLLDEYICVTPYCVHYDGLTGMVMIVVLFVHLWFFYICV